jgi:hypothetical protein
MITSQGSRPFSTYGNSFFFFFYDHLWKDLNLKFRVRNSKNCLSFHILCGGVKESYQCPGDEDRIDSSIILSPFIKSIAANHLTPPLREFKKKTNVTYRRILLLLYVVHQQ